MALNKRQQKVYIERLIVDLIEKYAHLSAAAVRLRVEICTEFHGQTVDTLACDGKNLLVNEEFFFTLTQAQQKGVLIHEILHAALGHHYRMQERHAEAFNVACDYVINLQVTGLGEELPPNVFLDDKFINWSEERVYDEIFKDMKQPKPQYFKPGSGDGDGKPTWKNVKATGKILKPTDEKGEELSPGECEQELADLADALTAGAWFAKQAGKGSHGQEGLIDRVRQPKRNWSSLFDEWASNAGTPTGRTRTKLDRRSLALGLYQPAHTYSGMREMVIAADMSSSVDMHRLRGFFGHIERVREWMHIDTIHIVPFNHDVNEHDVKKIRGKKKLPLTFDIGGGTRFAAVFEYITKAHLHPDACIVFTDLDCDDHGRRPKFPVLWASSDPITERNRPPWGKVIEIDIVR